MRCLFTIMTYLLSCTKGHPGIMVATMPGLSPAPQLTLGAAALGSQAQLCGTQKNTFLQWTNLQLFWSLLHSSLYLFRFNILYSLLAFYFGTVLVVPSRGQMLCCDLDISSDWCILNSIITSDNYFELTCIKNTIKYLIKVVK